MRGSSSASPSICASSSTVNSASRMCWPGSLPAPGPSPGPPSPWPRPWPPGSWTKRGSSRCGIGIETTCLPWRPSSSCRPRCRFSSSRTLPRTIWRNLLTSDWILDMTPRGTVADGLTAEMRSLSLFSPLLDVAAGEDAGHEVQDVGGARVAVAVVAHEAALDDVDLFLRVLVDHARDQARQLDRILLVLEQLQL